MALRGCRGVLITCIAWAGIPTFCLSTFGDQFVKDRGGPLYWIASAVVGIAIGALAGLLACVLARPKDERQLLPDPDLESAKRADEREVRLFRYLLGISFSVVGVVIASFALHAIRDAIRDTF